MKRYLKILSLLVLIVSLLYSCAHLTQTICMNKVYLKSTSTVPYSTYTSIPYDEKYYDKSVLILVDNSIHLASVAIDYRASNEVTEKKQDKLTLRDIEEYSTLFGNAIGAEMIKNGLSSGKIIVGDVDDIKKIMKLNTHDEKMEYLKNKYEPDIILSIKLYKFFWAVFSRVKEERKIKHVYSYDFIYEMIDMKVSKIMSSGWIIKGSDYTNTYKKGHLDFKIGRDELIERYFKRTIKNIYYEFDKAIRKRRKPNSFHYPVLMNLRYRDIRKLYMQYVEPHNFLDKIKFIEKKDKYGTKFKIIQEKEYIKKIEKNPDTFPAYINKQKIRK